MENQKGRRGRAAEGMLLLCLLLSGALFFMQEGVCRHDIEIEGKEHVQTMAWYEAPEGSSDKLVPRVAITFDDGPHPRYTEYLLDGLKKRGVRATFFVTGEHAKLHPDIIRRIHKEGHLLGNHTYSHIQLTKSNHEKFKEELQETNEILCKITGESPQYIRPPYGSWDKSLEAEMNMFPILWNVDSLDWETKNVDSITSNVIKCVKDGSIILMHDYYETSVDAALRIIDELQKQGYSFVTVEEILFD